jgi:hypothetical protein
MSIDTAAILAARYHKNPAPLKAAVLGQGDANINPYAALRALQLQKEAERYEMAQAAMRGQQMQNQPSMVEQALTPTPPQMPPQMQQPQGLPGMQQAQQPQPQGLPAMQQAQQPQPSPGLEGMPVPEGSDADYAGGGIVAFAGDPEDGSYVDDGEQLSMADLAEVQDSNENRQVSSGDPASYQSIAARLPGLLKNIENAEYKAFTPEQYKDAFTKRRALIEEGTEPSPYGELKQQIAGLEGERAQNLGQARGMAMLAAAGDIMQPGGLMRGLGAAGKTFAGMYGQAMQADKAEKRALMSMQFNLADAQRKEKMGLNREAIAAADQARQDHTAAQRFGLEKTKAMATVASNMARATKPTGTRAPTSYDSLVNGLYGEMKYKNDQLPENERLPDQVLLANAHRAAGPLRHQTSKTSDYQSAVAAYIKEDTEANNKLPEDQRKSPAFIEAEAYRKAAPLLIGKLDPKEVMDVRKREATTDEKSQADLEKDRKEQRRLEEERNRIDQERQQREARQEETNFQKAQIEWQQAETARRKAIVDEQKKLRMDRDYIQATPERKAEMRKEIEDKYPAAPKPERVAPPPRSDAAPAPAPAPAPRRDSGNKNSQVKASSGKVITRADIKETAKASGRTEAEVEAAAKKAGYTIK